MKLTPLLAALAAAPLAAQTTTRASVDSGGAQANGFSENARISDDGRFVAFVSLASNLAPGDVNGAYDVFVRDRVSGATVQASVNSAGAGGSAVSGGPDLSTDGRFVSFESPSWNLVAGDNNFLYDVFVRDLAAGTTERVSVGTSGSEADANCHSARISRDGACVTFNTDATTLVAGDTNGVHDVFLRDRPSGTTTRVSLASGGGEADGDSYWAAMSTDARYVAFVSEASNLAPGDVNGETDIFVRDRQLATTVLVSVGQGGAPAGGGSLWPSISGDGRFVAFESTAANLVVGDSNGVRDVFVRDLSSDATVRASVDTSGVQANDASERVSLSGDGRWLAFQSLGTNLVLGDTNNRSDVFLRDRIGGTTQRISVDSSGAQANGNSYQGVVSIDGRFVAFHSAASNLVPGDTNNQRDVFVRERFLAPTPYCTAGTTTSGCVPSIAASGSPSATATSGFTLSASSVEGQRSGLFFYGISGPVAVPWGTSSTSFLCVKTPTQRTPVQSSGGSFFACDGALSLDLLAFLAANPGALGQPIAMGQRYDAQAWFRDPPAPKTTNLSNAIEFDLGP